MGGAFSRRQRVHIPPRALAEMSTAMPPTCPSPAQAPHTHPHTHPHPHPHRAAPRRAVEHRSRRERRSREAARGGLRDGHNSAREKGQGLEGAGGPGDDSPRLPAGGRGEGVRRPGRSGRGVAARHLALDHLDHLGLGRLLEVRRDRVDVQHREAGRVRLALQTGGDGTVSSRTAKTERWG